MARKDVFISATGGDLGSYREVAKQAVLAVVQVHARHLLDPSQAVVHAARGSASGRRGLPSCSRKRWHAAFP